MILTTLLLFALLSLTGFVWQADDAPPCDGLLATGEPLQVGMIFPPSFGLGNAGADAQRGVTAMAAAINACGGINGHPIELITAEAGNTDQAVAAAESFQGVVPLVIGSGSTVIHEAVAEVAETGAFMLWEVTEPLMAYRHHVYSPRPAIPQLGGAAAAFSLDQVAALIDQEPPRIALITENYPQAEALADGVETELAANNVVPLIQRTLDADSWDYGDLAVQVREMDINVMITAMSSEVMDRWWSAMRQADANVSAWLTLSTEMPLTPDFYPCGVTTFSAASENNLAGNIYGDTYALYLDEFQSQFGESPSPRADLSALGVYLLSTILVHGPPGYDIMALDVHDFSSLLVGTAVGNNIMAGENWRYDDASGFNQNAQTIIGQVQEGGLCILSPDQLATCSNPLQSLDTWRDRVRGASQCSS